MLLINRRHFTDFLKRNFALFAVLIGAAFVFISLGPYTNWDSEIEYVAASSVVLQGVPFATPGNLINQPPIGFYINALFLKVFGLSYETGVGVVTLFGLGCVFLVHEIGKMIYGKDTGLTAAGLFALTPWHVVLSRSFLIDTQCLFFSLLSLIIGIFAVRKASLRMTLFAGVIFGIALLTKLFAIFTLIPLALVYAHYGPRDLKHLFGGIVIFLAPGFVMHYSWYELISRLGMFSVFTHSDFLSPHQGVTPSPFFLISYFISNPGLLLLLAVGFSVSLSLWKRKELARILFSDLILFVTVVGVAGVNMFLVVVLGLWVPYVDPVKYDYQLLPALCLLAASLVSKLSLLNPRSDTGFKQNKLSVFVLIAGLFLIIASIVVNMLVLSNLMEKDFLLFKVEGDVGFSFSRLAPAVEEFYLAVLQRLGFLSIVIGLLWASKDRISNIGHRGYKPKLETEFISK